MLNTWPVSLLVGTVLGFLSGLGVGGGSLLILWLTLVISMDQATARSLNLLFFLPAAAVACLFRWKQDILPIRKVLPAIAAGCLSALALSFLSRSLDTALLKKFFGILLLFTGARELLWKQKAKHRPS